MSHDDMRKWLMLPVEERQAFAQEYAAKRDANEPTGVDVNAPPPDLERVEADRRRRLGMRMMNADLRDHEMRAQIALRERRAGMYKVHMAQQIEAQKLQWGQEVMRAPHSRMVDKEFGEPETFRRMPNALRDKAFERMPEPPSDSYIAALEMQFGNPGVAEQAMAAILASVEKSVSDMLK